MNEEYGIGAETTTTERAGTADPGERRKALTILSEMNVLKVQKAVGRAYRSTTTTTKDGHVRRYRIGQNVASMASWLHFWEGKGELPGDWVHKAAAEWREETELTEAMLRTARKVGKEEGLWEEEKHLRSDDREVVKYRLNVMRLLQIANTSEIDNVERRIARARNNTSKRAALERELEKLEAVRDEMGLFAGPPETPGDDETRAGTAFTPGEEDTPTPPKETTRPCENSGGTQSICTDYRGAPQGSTAGDSPEGTSLSNERLVVVGSDSAAPDLLPKNKERQTKGTFALDTEEAMRVIYARLKEAGIRVPRWRYVAMKCDVDRGEYGDRAWEDPGGLAELLIGHHEETGEVDHVAAWPPDDENDLEF